jgi:hypothetical protein
MPSIRPPEISDSINCAEILTAERNFAGQTQLRSFEFRLPEPAKLVGTAGIASERSD